MRDSSPLLQAAPGPLRPGFDHEALPGPEQAVLAYLGRAALRPFGTESVSLEAAVGRVLARDAVAREDHPAHARSTMDGFALSSAEAPGRLTIAGDILMGHAPVRALGPREVLRIPTGGALPEGADTVVPLEDVRERDGAIETTEHPAAGEYVTPRGADVRAGETLLRAGRRLFGPELGVLATLGITQVPVYRQPRFAVISTGDELIDPAAELAIGTVRDSNRYAIAASLHALGAVAVHLPRVHDDARALHAALSGALETCDGIVLTGGSSVGERDFTPRVVASLGEPGPIVHGLRVKPGKPTLLAAVRGKPVIGLPGNPASALMILEAVVRPIVLACTGEAVAPPREITAIAERPFAGREGWTWFVPAAVRVERGVYYATPLVLRSALTSLLARAAGYATLGESAFTVAAGANIRITPFSAGGAPIEVTG